MHQLVILIVIIILLIVIALALLIVCTDNNVEEWIYLPFYRKLRSLGENPPDYCRVLADKLRVKEVVSQRCPEVKVANVIWSSSTHNIPRLVDILMKNKKYMFKSNNASARNLVIGVNSNKAALENKAREWLSKQYRTSETTEKFYSQIKPYIFIEELIDMDYELRIFCFHGKPHYIRYRKGNCIAYYNMRGEKLDLTQYYSKVCSYTNIDIDRVSNIATQLSDGIAFVCVDLMITKGDEVYFCEYTFCPNNSARTFVPDRYQAEFSNLWKYLD